MRKFFKIFGRIVLALLIVGLVLINIIAYNHAYNFTHFTSEEIKVPKSIEELTLKTKISYLFWGFRAPHPTDNDVKMPKNYQKVNINSGSGETLECWYRQNPHHISTVILYHGYTNVKTYFLREAEAFYKMGYNVLLVDFQGHGGSTGNFTSIGYFESLDVLATYDFVSRKTGKNGQIILFGHSMGSVATLKAISEYKITPDALILECPYRSMLDAVKSRIHMLKMPSWGLAELLVFWGSVQNNYWAFSLDCEQYAKDIKTPTLLMYGLKDQRVTTEEINSIYNALESPNKLQQDFEEAGHQPYFKVYPVTWTKTVKTFLSTVK